MFYNSQVMTETEKLEFNIYRIEQNLSQPIKVNDDSSKYYSFLEVDKKGNLSFTTSIKQMLFLNIIVLIKETAIEILSHR